MLSADMKSDFENKLERHIQRSLAAFQRSIGAKNCLICNHSRDEVHQAFKSLEKKLRFRLVELDYEDIVVLREEVFSNDEIRLIRFSSESEEWRFDNETEAKNFLDGFSDRFVLVSRPDGHSNHIRLNDYAYHLLNDEPSALLIYGMQGHYSSRHRRILLDFLKEKKSDEKRLVNFVEAFILMNPPIDKADLQQIKVEDGKGQFLIIQ